MHGEWVMKLLTPLVLKVCRSSVQSVPSVSLIWCSEFCAGTGSLQCRVTSYQLGTVCTTSLAMVLVLSQLGWN